MADPHYRAPKRSAIPREEFHIPVPGLAVHTVSATLDSPVDDPGRSAVLFAHGAGAGLDSSFMSAVAGELARRGLFVMRFNYAYAERMRRLAKRAAPDRRPQLEEVHRAALEHLRARLPGRRVVLAGKSMGGRIASYLAAAGEEVAGLAYLGYPLHPPGEPDALRSEHFGAIAQPSLFLAGARDALCRLDLLERELEAYGGVTTLEVVAGADPDFRVPRSDGRSRAEVLAHLAATVDAWERRTFP